MNKAQIIEKRLWGNTVRLIYNYIPLFIGGNTKNIHHYTTILGIDPLILTSTRETCYTAYYQGSASNAAMKILTKAMSMSRAVVAFCCELLSLSPTANISATTTWFGALVGTLWWGALVWDALLGLSGGALYRGLLVGAGWRPPLVNLNGDFC